MNEHRIREIVREELAKARDEFHRDQLLRLSEKNLVDEMRRRDANGSIPAKWPNDEPMNRPTPAETEAGRKVMDALRGLSIREAQALLKDCSKRLVENLPLNADLGLDTII